MYVPPPIGQDIERRTLHGTYSSELPDPLNDDFEVTDDEMKCKTVTIRPPLPLLGSGEYHLSALMRWAALPPAVEATEPLMLESLINVSSL